MHHLGLLGCGKKMSVDGVDEVDGSGQKKPFERHLLNSLPYHSKKIIIKTIDMTFLMRYI
jgi:hypothetical protein